MYNDLRALHCGGWRSFYKGLGQIIKLIYKIFNYPYSNQNLHPELANPVFYDPEKTFILSSKMKNGNDNNST